MAEDEMAGYVVARLEEAGRTLFCLPRAGGPSGIRSAALDVIRTAAEVAAGDSTGRIRMPIPSSARITAMDEAYDWLGLIPDDRYVIRRIVAARSLVNPTTERHLFSWRRLGTMLGADHRAVPRWHAEGIGMIVRGLRRAGSRRDAA